MERCFNSRKQFEDLGLHRNIERSGGFVGDQQAGAIHQSHRDQDALPLAAGKLVGIIVKSQMRFWNRNGFECLDARWRTSALERSR